MVGRAKRAVGVDIGTHRIKIVVLKRSKTGIELEHFHIEPLPHGSIVDHQIMDALQVGQTLSRMVTAAKARGKEAATAVYGKGVMIKKIVTDRMSEDELAAAIPYEAEHSLPFDVREVTLDYAPLPPDLDAEGMEVLLVAAKNDLVYSMSDTLRDAGCKPALLDVEPFALQATLIENGELDNQTTLAVLQIGFQASTVTLFESGRFEGSRDISVAGRTYVEELIRRRGITFERAITLLSSEKLSEGDKIALQEIARHTGERLADAALRSFPSNFGPAADQPVSRVLLCGGGAHLPGIVPVLSEKLGTDVELADPLRFASPVDGREDCLKAVAPDLTTAAGLALRGLGGAYPGFNLLPPEEQRDGKKDHLTGASIVLPILGFAILLLVMVITTVVQENKLGILKRRLVEVQQEAALYADKIAIVEELTAKRNDIAKRITLIEQLDHDRFLRIHLLDEINRALPSLTWLTSVREEGPGEAQSLVLDGVTSSNLQVAELMGNLVASPYFTNVNLTVTEKGEIANTGVTKFTLTAEIKSASAEIPASPEKEDLIAQGTRAVRQARAAQQKEP
jgi:type IV pilus assembly protein PilM